MAEPAFDTSGRIAGDIEGLAVWWEFDDLSPFVQGCVAGLLSGPIEYPDPNEGWGPSCSPRFDWLAPETLARIMADCERFQHPTIGAADWVVFDENAGRDFWRDRQAGQLTRYSSRLFPPLTPFLADDGLVRFREPQP